MEPGDCIRQRQSLVAGPEATGSQVLDDGLLARRAAEIEDS